MAQYIDKAALVAEIEKKRDEAYPNSEWNHGYVTACEKILSFLDTLEVKEVDLDFNAEVSKFINTSYKNTKIGHRLMIRRTARYFYELGLKAKGE